LRAVERVNRCPIFRSYRNVQGFSTIPSPPIQKSGLPPLPKPAAGMPVA
jgi:hypothetical protein